MPGDGAQPARNNLKNLIYLASNLLSTGPVKVTVLPLAEADNCATRCNQHLTKTSCLKLDFFIHLLPDYL